MGLYNAHSLRRKSRVKKRAIKSYRQKMRGKQYDRLLGTRPLASGIVIQKIGKEAKQPNSAIRKCLRIKCTESEKIYTAFCPEDGSLRKVDNNDVVVVCGLGKKHRSTGDIPGVKYRVCKISGVPVRSLATGKAEKPAR